MKVSVEVNSNAVADELEFSISTAVYQIVKVYLQDRLSDPYGARYQPNQSPLNQQYQGPQFYPKNQFGQNFMNGHVNLFNNSPDDKAALIQIVEKCIKNYFSEASMRLGMPPTFRPGTFVDMDDSAAGE